MSATYSISPALGTLYDLYDACLDRMEFVATAPEGSGPCQLVRDVEKVMAFREECPFWVESGHWPQ